MYNENEPRNNYPLATKDGGYIPLDIIRPVGMTKKSISAISVMASVSPTAKILVLWATVNCVFKGVNSASMLTIADGISEADAVFVPANTSVVVTADFPAYVIASISGDGYAIIQEVEQWAGISLGTNFIKR